jgi:ABC-type dipeptide/oligopeptide/nickel transport system permease component
VEVDRDQLMVAFLVRRLLTMLLVFWVISVLIFAMVHLAPGDPVSMMIPPDQYNAGTAEYLAQVRAELGLDRPLPLQYFSWLGDALTGNLGYSVASNRPVVDLIAERIGPTIELMGLSLLLGLVVAVPLGVLAAVKRNGVVDYVATLVSLVTISTPTFFLGIVAIYVFSLRLGWLPSAGMSDPTDQSVPDILRHLVMPVTILGLGMAGQFTRYVRASMVSELSSDYVRTALAKGVGMRTVLFRHVLRNAMIPVITVVALSFPALLGGAVVVEQVFAWPGMGQLSVTAVQRQDYSVIIGFALLVAVLVLVSNLLADLLYSVVDPRVVLE